MRKLFVLSAIIYSILAAAAQNNEQWSLERCIKYAVENNIQVKQAQTNVELNKLRNTQSKFDYLPSLSASVGYSMSFGRSLDQTTYQYVNDRAVNNANSSLSLGTQVFAGMTKLYNLRKSELNLLASVQDVERTKNDITLSIAAAYLQILYNKEQITTSNNQITLLEEQIAKTQNKVDVGSLPQGSVLELKAQLSAEQYNLVSLQNTLANSTLTLTQLLELRQIDGFDIEIPNVSNIIAQDINDNVNDVNETAQSLPQIKASEIRLKASQMDIKLAKARYYPTLSLNVGYGSSFSDARKKPILAPDGELYYDKYPFFEQFGDNVSGAISMSMQIPIFNGLTTRRNVSMARYNEIMSQYDLQNTKNKLFKEIQQAYTDATGAFNRYNSAVSSVNSNEESFRYAENKLSANSITTVEYILAKNNLLQAQSMMIQAKYEYIFRVKLLDFYKGIPITL